MKLKYRIKLKGTNCYLKNTGTKSANFTTDVNKAKVFEKEYCKPDIIDKLNFGDYKVKKESHRTDSIRLTMDKATWQEMYNEHLDQLQEISDGRKEIHQFTLSLVDLFNAKVKGFSRTEEFPNFECTYYGEDFEREKL